MIRHDGFFNFVPISRIWAIIERTDADYPYYRSLYCCLYNENTGVKGKGPTSGFEHCVTQYGAILECR